MFGNLSLDSEERRTNDPVLKVEPTPEVIAIVENAWGKQQAAEKSLGHIVGPIDDEELLAQFHAQARAACTGHEPKLRYRKLTRVGKSKDANKAYFAVALWDDAESEPESAEQAEKPPTRRRTAK